MIVTVTLPANATRVTYGALSFLADENQQLDVPAYVAKSFSTLGGVNVVGDISLTAAELLAATADDALFESNYIFQAYGKPLPQDVIEITEHLNEDGSPQTEEDGNPIPPTIDTTPVDKLAEAVALMAARGAPICTLG